MMKTFRTTICTLCTIVSLTASLHAQNVNITVDVSTVTHSISDRLYGVNANIGDNEQNGTNTNFNNKMTHLQQFKNATCYISISYKAGTGVVPHFSAS